VVCLSQHAERVGIDVEKLAAARLAAARASSLSEVGVMEEVEGGRGITPSGVGGGGRGGGLCC